MKSIKNKNHRHKFNSCGCCIKCGDTVRFNHIGEPFCLFPDDEETLRCVDVEKELSKFSH